MTFRFRDPNAKEVHVTMEGSLKPLPMQKDDEGDWSVTTEPLAPEYYGYSFVADGVSLIDPENPLIRPNLLGSRQPRLCSRNAVASVGSAQRPARCGPPCPLSFERRRR